MRIPPDLIALSDTQNRLLTSGQIRGAGITWRQQTSWAAAGLLTSVRPGVFKFGPEPATEWQFAAATVLAAGPGAVLSHRSAARTHRLPLVLPASAIEITVPRGRNPTLIGATVHRSQLLLPADITRIHEVPVTSAARTLVEIAPLIPPGALGKLLDEGRLDNQWTWPELVAMVARFRRRAAVDSLRVLLADRMGTGADVGLEARIVAVLEGFRPFEIHYRLDVNGSLYELDIAWPAYRVAAECDGWAVRSKSRSKFDLDRRKGNALVAAGWTVVRLTSAMRDDEIRGVVHRALLLAAGRLA